MRALARWGALLALAAPSGAWALGLGDIELKSALNQPLQAEIALVSATPEEVEGLRVALASRETFDRYGLDRPAYLSSLEFRVGRNAQGRDVIHVTSRQSVSEPFLTLLVEAVWPRGRLLREYTLLIDPPLLLPSSAEPVLPARTQPPQPQGASAPIARPQEPQPAAAAPATPPAAAAPAARAPTPAPGGTYGPVQRAETLWGIATRLLPQGATLNQMMVALYEANPQAFDGNMNVLRAGAVLTIPELADVQRLSAAAANAEFQRQNQAWQGGVREEPRLRLVAAGGDAPAGASASAPAATADGGNAEAARLRGEVSSLRAELEETRRLLQLRDEQLSQLQARASEPAPVPVPEPAGEVRPAEPVVSSSVGVDLEEQLFADESPAEVAVVPAVETPAEPAAPVRAATPAPAAVVATPEEPGLVARVLSWLATPMLWIGLGLVAVLGAALWFLRSRREEAEDVTGRWEALEAEIDEEVAVPDLTDRMRAPSHEDSIVVEERSTRPPAPEPRGAAAAVAAAGAAAMARPDAESTLEQTDVLAEADFHMAYGLYDQAAELVSSSLQSNPSRRDLKLKLLEVYFVWGNKQAFADAARDLRDEMGGQPDSDWDKVLIMGKQICPDEDLFMGSAPAAGEVDVDLAGGDSPALDLEFGESESLGVDLDLGDVEAESELDLAFDGTHGTHGRHAFTPTDDDDTSRDDEKLDIGAQTAASIEEALLLEDSGGEEEDEEPDGHGAQQTLAATDVGIAATEVDSLAATQESPTVETPRGARGASSFSAEDWDEAPTMETPTMETPAADDVPTMETPTVESPVARGTEGAEGGTLELPTVEQPRYGADTADHTAEIDLDDLGLDLEDLQGLPDDLADVVRQRAEAKSGRSSADEELAADDILSSTGVTSMHEDDDPSHVITGTFEAEEVTLLAHSMDEDARFSGTEVLEQRLHVDESGDTSLVRALGSGGDSLDVDLSDLSEQAGSGDTVEQPRETALFTRDVFSGGNGVTPVDLDIGFDAGEDVGLGDDAADQHGMTEVGTKLDLARAYIDMGDPEGARSILEEVLDEGDPGQRQEAQTLMEALRA